MNIFRIVRLRNKVLNTTCQDVWFGVKIWGTSVHKDWSYRIMALPIQSVAASILKWNNLEGSPLEEKVPKPTNLSLSSHSFQFIHTTPARALSRYYSASRKYKSSWLEPSKHSWAPPSSWGCSQYPLAVGTEIKTMSELDYVVSWPSKNLRSRGDGGVPWTCSIALYLRVLIIRAEREITENQIKIHHRSTCLSPLDVQR